MRKLRISGKNRILLAVSSLTFIGSLFLLGFRDYPHKPNVVLITIDCLRKDHLGYSGYPRNTTPQIDKIASESTVFTNAFTVATWTLPSMYSIATSTYPQVHGVMEVGDEFDTELITIFDVLNSYGYTSGFFSNSGLFDSYFSELKSLDYFLDNPKLKAHHLTKRVKEWIQRRDNPFFIWIHYFDLHPPYTPPPRFRNLFMKDPYFQEKVIPVEKMACIYRHIFLDDPEAGEANIGEIVANYDAELRFADEQVGELIEYLKSSSENRYIIIISADHGESLGERTGNFFKFGHGNAEEEVVSIPLLIQAEGILKKGKVIDSYVRSIDILPTVLDILRINYDEKAFQGRSLFPLMREERWEKIPYLFSTNTAGIDFIRTEKWKLIHLDRERLYRYLLRMRSDIFSPSELVNMTKEMFRTMEKQNLFLDGNYVLINLENEHIVKDLSTEGYTQVYRDLKNRLDEWRQIGREKSHRKEIPEALRKRLKSLGYMQ